MDVGKSRKMVAKSKIKKMKIKKKIILVYVLQDQDLKV